MNKILRYPEKQDLQDRGAAGYAGYEEINNLHKHFI